MAAITTYQMAVVSCHAALTSKIEAVQLDVGLIRQGLDKVQSGCPQQKHRWAMWRMQSKKTLVRSAPFNQELRCWNTGLRTSKIEVNGIFVSLAWRKARRVRTPQCLQRSCSILYSLRFNYPHTLRWRGPTVCYHNPARKDPLLVPLLCASLTSEIVMNCSGLPERRAKWFTKIIVLCYSCISS